MPTRRWPCTQKNAHKAPESLPYADGPHFPVSLVQCDHAASDQGPQVPPKDRARGHSLREGGDLLAEGGAGFALVATELLLEICGPA